MVRVSGCALINTCKVFTALAIAAFAYRHGFATLRPVIYTALHGSYLAWWFMHQRLSPTWGPTVFPVADIPLPVLALVFVVVGPGYALGAYYAFTSAVEPPPLLVGAAIMIFVWGSLINAGTDFYKDGFKAAKPKAVVTGGPFALARHINWFGDWLRYGSFALISGHPAGLAPLAWTVMLNLTSLGGRAAGHAARGGAEYEKYVARTPAVVPWRLLC